jgi:arylsulfatase A-like enzyme
MPDRPNLLLLTTDQHRFDFVTGGVVLGLELAMLDRLRREGTCFSQATSVCRICMPARFAWTSGLYPSQVAQRLMSNGHDWPTDLPTMPRALQRAGYRTGLIGKLHAKAGLFEHDLRDDRDLNRQVGYDDLVEVAGKSLVHWFDCDWTQHLREVGLLDDYRRHLAGRGDLFGKGPPYPPNPLPIEHNIDAFVADEAVRWIGERDASVPWYLHASFCAPHFPVDPPGDYACMFRPEDMPLPEGDCPPNQVEARRAHRAAYCGLLRFVDDQMARVLDALDHAGLSGDTLVICCTDHGDMLGHHGRINKSRPEDTSVRTPVTIRWPGRLEAGTRNDRPVESIDVPATLLAAAGLDARQELPNSRGISVLDEASARRDAYSECGQGQTQWRMIRTPAYKYVRWGDGQESLFDLIADPWERDDLSGVEAHAATLIEFRRRLLERVLHHVAADRMGPPPVDLSRM